MEEEFRAISVTNPKDLIVGLLGIGLRERCSELAQKKSDLLF